jgi:hypothetical protein
MIKSNEKAQKIGSKPDFCSDRTRKPGICFENKNIFLKFFESSGPKSVPWVRTGGLYGIKSSHPLFISC